MVVWEFFKGLFGIGGGKNVIAETVEVFRPNAENSAQRAADFQSASLGQYASEFLHEKKGWFDRLIDGLNRLPRPALALGTIGLFISAMHDPIWFAERMTALELVPTELWWLLGAIVTFYFGAREGMKNREAAMTIGKVRTVVDSMKAIQELEEDPTVESPVEVSDNPALSDWRKS